MKMSFVKGLVLSMVLMFVPLCPVAADAKTFGKKTTRISAGESVRPNIENVETSRTFMLPPETNVKVWNGPPDPGKENFICLDEFFVSSEREDLNW